MSEFPGQLPDDLIGDAQLFKRCHCRPTMGLATEAEFNTIKKNQIGECKDRVKDLSDRIDVLATASKNKIITALEDMDNHDHFDKIRQQFQRLCDQRNAAIRKVRQEYLDHGLKAINGLEEVRSAADLPFALAWVFDQDSKAMDPIETEIWVD